MVLWTTNRGGRIRPEVAFALGNLLVASVLISVLSALPVRFWLVDGVLALAALVLLVSGVAALARLPRAGALMRVAAYTLLIVGLAVVALAVLTLAFLSGVHGRWLQAGVPLTGVTLALLVPYTVAYPIAQLVYGSRAREDHGA